MNGIARTHARLRRFALIIGVAVLLQVACVERTIRINTEPQGATVILNDQDVGKSPVRVPFTWYGDYDIIIRKEGHKTILTNHRLKAPWYQWPFIDLFSECLVPYTIRDDRELETFVLEPAVEPNKDELVERADEMRARTQAEIPSGF